MGVARSRPLAPDRRALPRACVSSIFRPVPKILESETVSAARCMVVEGPGSPALPDGESELVAVTGAVSANGFVGHVAGTTLDAVVDADLTDGTESLVVKSGNAEGGEQLLIELAQILEMSGERGQLQAVVGQEKFLVASVPQPRETAFEHNRGGNGHLVAAVGALTELRARAIFFHADD